MSKKEVMEKIKGKLIVSCQALEDEPLHSSYIMGRMAYAAYEGGAAGIRANSVQDIKEIKISVDLPIIGIIKKVYENNKVFISPTLEEIDKLTDCGVDIIATDGTNRIRPGNRTLDDFFKEVRKKYPNQLFMADCSTYEEGIHAAEIGFDFIGTTLSGYTEYTKGTPLPDIHMIERLVKDLDKPVIAEGGIWSPSQLKQVLDLGAYAAVVGTAITRPREITKRYVEAII